MTPTTEQMRDVLLHVARLLEPVCWLYDGGYHFRLPVEGWTISLAPYSAGRVRIDACRGTVPVMTAWCHVHDRGRLDEIIRELRDRAAAVIASV